MNTTLQLAELEQRFGIPAIARVCRGNGGLPRVTISSSHGLGEIYLHGAHVTSWCPAAHDEVLFLSTKARWQEGHAIRGGIPICFPWFRANTNDPQAPAHGFVRTKMWQLESIVQSDAGVVVTMFTASDHESRRWWPAEFRLVYRATFGSELRLELTCSNIGSGRLRFEEALHTYNRVADVGNLHLQGLGGTRFRDNTDSNKEKRQLHNIVVDSQMDNAFLDTRSAVDLVDPELRRRIRLEKANSLTTVVWNPWREGAARMQDLSDGEWRQFLCVEASNIMESAVELEPGEKHTITAVLSVTKL